MPRSFELFPVALAKISIWPMLQFSPDARLAYVVTYERVRERRGIGVIDTGTGRVVSELLAGLDVRGVHLSPDGTRLYALAGDSESSQQARLLLVDPATGNVLARTDLFPGAVWGIAAVATP